MNELSWREPMWLFVAMVPWGFLCLGLFIKRFSMQSFADVALLPWVRARPVRGMQLNNLLRFLCLAGAWLCFAVVLAGPRTPKAIYATGEASVANVMIVVDVSRSMTARDVMPGRLERARLELIDLLQRSQGIRYGIVVYAARPHLLLPPTADKRILKYYLNMLRKELLPTEGSDLQAALRLATHKSTTGGRYPDALLLVTDGGLASQDEIHRQVLHKTIANINQQGTRLFALGVGTISGSSILDKNSGWLKYDDQVINSKLDAGLLKAMALVGQGKYAQVSDSDSDWRSLYNNGLALLGTQTSQINADAIIEWSEHYPLWLILGATLFLLAHGRVTLPSPTTMASVLVIAISFGAVSMPATGYADEVFSINNAYAAYIRADYERAGKLYARIAGYAGRMGEGSSAYHLEEYELAVQSFILAALEAKDDRQRAQALFNLANCYFKSTDYAAAAAIYSDVLRYQPSFKPAQLNLEYALVLKKKKESAGTATLATRAGRGPRSARAADNVDISQGGISLGDSTNENNFTLPAAPDAQPASGDADRIQSVESAMEQSEEFKDTQWQYEITDANSINQYINRIETDESVFWQRMFEGEEGFVAPVDEPHEVPGVRPW